MRSCFITDNIPYITLILVFLLQGCGHKGPLMLPAPKPTASPAQTSSDQTTNPQKADPIPAKTSPN